MSALSWLSEFFEERNCESNKPDGRPLFAYRCTLEEFNSLKSLLIKAEKNVDGTKLHLGYALSTGYLFTLYCAEWWRRYYIGGVPKWLPIIESLGWDHNTWNTRIEFVVKGLRYWKRDLIQTGAAKQYLFSVASEGGIPISALEREGASFKHFLKAVIREYGHYASSGLSAERIAQDNLYRLPSTWQQEQIAALAGKIVEQVWSLKTKIGDSTEPVKTLNAVYPEWNTEFPLELESEQAETLVNSLLTIARVVASGDSQVLRVERNLDVGHGGWLLSAKLFLPKELDLDQIIAMGSMASAHDIPERMEMYRVIGDERVLVARLSGEGKTRFIRPVPGATHSYTENADKELGLILVARGQDVTSLSVAGGAELDPDLPWSFIMTDDDMKHFRWVGLGGCRRRDPDIFVLSNLVPKPLASGDSNGVDEVEKNVLGKTLWWITKPAELCSEQDDEIYRIEPDLESIAARDYRLIGVRHFFPQTRYSAYRTVPKIQLVNDDSVNLITDKEIFWRPIGTRQWRRYEQDKMVGDIELRHRYGMISLASWKLSILPEQAKITIEPNTRLEGSVSLIFPNARAATVKDVTGLGVNTEQLEDGWRIQCKRHDISIGNICCDLSWENERRMSFSLPFPAEGASFVDGEGKDISATDLLTLTRLYGYRAQVVSPHQNKKYILRGSLSTKNNSLPSIEFHKFELSMVVDKFGVSTLPLQQLKSEIEMLFAVSTGVDDQVKLELFEASSLNAEACVLVQQFEGVLYSDTTRRMILLAANSSELSEDYIDVSLSLISVNDINSEPIVLEWNEVSHGWTLPDYSEESINLSYTYFVSLNCENSYNIRPCVIPPESEFDNENISMLAKAMTISNTIIRKEEISQYLAFLLAEGDEEQWRELCGYIKRLSCVHPDGLDLVESILEFPEIMAAVWFRAVPDQSLRDYLNKICETSPFSWWMISIKQWCSGEERWLFSLNNLAESVKIILIEECKKILENLSSDNEEMNTIVDVLIENLGKKLAFESVLSIIRNNSSEQSWILLDQAARFYFTPCSDDWWPQINTIFSLQKKLSTKIYHYIQWPKSGMGYKRAITQSPIIGAAALQEGITFNEDQRIALLAARNFHPTAFATLFRATQAILWINKEEIINE